MIYCLVYTQNIVKPICQYSVEIEIFECEEKNLFMIEVKMHFII